MWKSSIRAVLAENNWNYLKSYDQLAEMGSGGFWTAVRNFFRHWSSSSSSSSSHKHRGGRDEDLMKELEILRKRKLKAQEKEDMALAIVYNRNEYERENQWIECDCCFGDSTFEELCFCSQGEHKFCHGCVTRFFNEGLFGQGTLRGATRIQCIAMEGCEGCLPTQSLQQSVPNDVWLAYEKSLLEVNVYQHHRLVQCANCNYAELDESARPLEEVIKEAQSLFALIMVVAFFLWTILLPFALWLLIFPLFLFFMIGQQWFQLKSDLEIAYERVMDTRRGGSVFPCPNCKQFSCLRCHRVVRGLHRCWEDQQDGLRLYVEKVRLSICLR